MMNADESSFARLCDRATHPVNPSTFGAVKPLTAGGAEHSVKKL